MTLESVNSGSKSEQKRSPIGTGLVLGAGVGVVADTVLNISGKREKSLLEDVENIAKNIKDSSPKADEFKSSTKVLSENLKLAIENKENTSVLKKIGTFALSLIGFADNDTVKYEVFSDFSKKLGNIGKIEDLKTHVNDAGHKSLEKIVKLGKNFEGGAFKQVGYTLYHSLKLTSMLGAAGLGVGLIYKLVAGNSDKKA